MPFVYHEEESDDEEQQNPTTDGSGADGGDADVCPICLDPLTGDVVCLLPCNHKYCSKCASGTFLERVDDTCAMCKSLVKFVRLPDDRRVPIIAPTELLLEETDRGRQHRDDSYRPISLAELIRLHKDKVNDVPTWQQLANAEACAACLDVGGEMTLCEGCGCGCHTGCQYSLLGKTRIQISEMGQWYCERCQTDWTTTPIAAAGSPSATAVVSGVGGTAAADDGSETGDIDGAAGVQVSGAALSGSSEVHQSGELDRSRAMPANADTAPIDVGVIDALQSALTKAKQRVFSSGEIIGLLQSIEGGGAASDSCLRSIRKLKAQFHSQKIGEEPIAYDDVVSALDKLRSAPPPERDRCGDKNMEKYDTYESAVDAVFNHLSRTRGKVFHSNAIKVIMTHTRSFGLIAKKRIRGTTSVTNTYILTPGGYRCAKDYGDQFHRLRDNVIDETRAKLMAHTDKIVVPSDVTSDGAKSAYRRAVENAVASWALQYTLDAERIFMNAVTTHVDAWDDFDLDGHLMGGDDAVIDTRSGQVVVRKCTRNDHVTRNVGYEIDNVLTNQTTEEYMDFKQKLLRIIKCETHRDYIMKFVATVVLNGNVAWVVKLYMAVCGPKDSAKTTLFLYVLKALGEYGGTVDFNELTTGQSTGSTNDAAMRQYLSGRRFCLIDEGEEDGDGRIRKRLMQSRIKGLMGNAPRKSRNCHTTNYVQADNFPFICFALNQSNMFPKPGNKDDLERWVLVNAKSLSKFKSGVEDGAEPHVYAKDADFVKPETMKENRLHMLSLLCEYYDPTFTADTAETLIPADLRKTRDDWDYMYDIDGFLALPEPDAGPPVPYYVLHDNDQTPEDAFDELVERTVGMLARAPGKFVLTQVRTLQTPRGGKG